MGRAGQRLKEDSRPSRDTRTLAPAPGPVSTSSRRYACIGAVRESPTSARIMSGTKCAKPMVFNCSGDENVPTLGFTSGRY